ncbi:hypothetical protein EDD85DRAFT_217844 [Armillaria nabsnona]|nr:hypothetical protein EDD85DRAFT_217844 [Armillaria nabsnona]
MMRYQHFCRILTRGSTLAVYVAGVSGTTPATERRRQVAGGASEDEQHIPGWPWKGEAEDGRRLIAPRVVVGRVQLDLG